MEIYKLKKATNSDHRLHIVMVIESCKDDFRGIFCVERGKGGLLGQGVMLEDLSPEKSILREENSMKGAQDFLALFKTN